MDSTVHGILQVRILEWVAFSFSRGSSQPRDQTQVSRIAGGFLLAESQGKPKNTGVGSLSLLQQIFLTQESNRGLLHCRWILYQLSYQGSSYDYVYNLNVRCYLLIVYYALGVGTIYDYTFSNLCLTVTLLEKSLHKWSHLGLGCFISLDIQLLSEKKQYYIKYDNLLILIKNM